MKLSLPYFKDILSFRVQRGIWPASARKHGQIPHSVRNDSFFIRLPVLALLICAQTVSAQSNITITPASSCKGKVRLTAQNVKLSEVLQRLSQALDFTLEYKSLDDPLISVDTQRPAIELIKSLTRSENLVLMDEADRRCKGARRIVKIALLPTGPETAARPLPPPPPRQMTPQETEGLALYRKAHGLDENGNPKPPPKQ